MVQFQVLIGFKMYLQQLEYNLFPKKIKINITYASENISMSATQFEALRWSFRIFNCIIVRILHIKFYLMDFWLWWQRFFYLSVKGALCERCSQWKVLPIDPTYQYSYMIQISSSKYIIYPHETYCLDSGNPLYYESHKLLGN